MTLDAAVSVSKMTDAAHDMPTMESDEDKKGNCLCTHITWGTRTSTFVETLGDGRQEVTHMVQREVTRCGLNGRHQEVTNSVQREVTDCNGVVCDNTVPSTTFQVDDAMNRFGFKEGATIDAKLYEGYTVLHHIVLKPMQSRTEEMFQMILKKFG